MVGNGDRVDRLMKRKPITGHTLSVPLTISSLYNDVVENNVAIRLVSSFKHGFKTITLTEGLISLERVRLNTVKKIKMQVIRVDHDSHNGRRKGRDEEEEDIGMSTPKMESILTQTLLSHQLL